MRTTMADLVTHTSGESADRATVRLDPDRTGEPVPETLFGKFGEHLYSPYNVDNVLEAQALYNPTMASWQFQDYEYGPDGGRGGVRDPEEVADRIDEYVEHQGVPAADRLREAYNDGTALWWFPYAESGDAAETVRTSPDVGTAGDRAQRVEVLGGDGEGSEAAAHRGIAQWTHLPVHRTFGFEGLVTLRAPAETPVRIAVHPVDEDGALGDALAATTVTARREDRTVEFDLDLPEACRPDGDGAPDDRLFGVSVTTPAADANLVVDRVLLRPDDHVHTADPEVVDLLREMDLSVLRWPGGNFASGYHWEDGIGPVADRPTKPNPAWDAVESNLFGTDELVALCEAVGCEPMICVNAGDGTPEEAARWVEYCNGDPEETEMGRLRAEHGHPEPYDVRYWEVGNEIYGPWQVTWTTPGGNADRFARFRAAMTDADEDIEVFACGNRLTDWNEPVIEELEDGDWLTDHVLVECHADRSTDPVELFNAHSGLASKLGAQYDEVARQCREAGLTDVRQAITELQLFTRFDEPEADEADGEGDHEVGEGATSGGDARLTRETLPTNKSVMEVVFDATVFHEALRSDTVEMVTHSGVGNHGGGIRKNRGRVWADPCYYGQALEAGLAGGTPVGVDVTCDTFSTATTWGTDTTEWFGELEPIEAEPAVDAVAVTDGAGGDLVVALVHCDAGATEIEVTVDGGDLLAGVDRVTVDTLTAETMHAENSLDDPERVTPETTTAPVADGEVTVSLPPYALVRLTADRT